MPQQVTFKTPSGKLTTRTIQDPNQIQGFLKSGFTVVEEQSPVQQATKAQSGLRPPTPAPTMLKDTSLTVSEDPLKSAAKKALKSQLGSMFTDEEIGAILDKQTDFTSGLKETEQQVKNSLEQLEKMRKQQVTDLETERRSLEDVRKKRIQELESAIRSSAARDVAAAEKGARETTAIEERLLGARGNLTTAVGAARLGNIQDQLTRTTTALNQAADAEIAFQKAQLEGADKAVLEQLASNIDATKVAQQQALIESAQFLQQAKFEAQQAGEAANMALIQNAIDQLSTQKVASEVDVAVTKQINDGFVYDKFGQKITDIDGNAIIFEKDEELQDLVEVSPGASLFDPTTGLPVFTAPTKDLIEGQATGAGTPSTYSLQKAENTLQSVKDLKTLAEKSPQIFGKTAALPIPDYARSEEFRNFKAQLDVLKSNIAFSELNAMREASKTGGALGQVSERELALLENNLGALSMKQSPANFVEQLDKIKKSIETWKNEVATSDGGFETLNITQKSGTPELGKLIGQLIEGGMAPNKAREFALEQIGGDDGAPTQSFNQVGGDTKPAVSNPLQLGAITGFGSPLWKHGLDIDLQTGDPVPTPVDGVVDFVGEEGGFGKQVRITDAKGNSVWLSHLSGFDVKVGDKVKAGQQIGKGGNTGSTIPGAGGDGSHLDLTVKKPDGTFMNPKEIYNALTKFA